jgi:hypothetical protein
MNATTDHGHHDELLVSAHVTGDLEGGDVARAEAQLAACAACRDLAEDLRAIRLAARQLPTPARPRSFELTQADAARLRPGGWRRLAAALAGPRLAFTRPLAAGLMTVGVAGLLLTTLPGLAGSSGGPEAIGSAANGGDGATTAATDALDMEQASAAPTAEALVEAPLGAAGSSPDDPRATPAQRDALSGEEYYAASPPVESQRPAVAEPSATGDTAAIERDQPLAPDADGELDAVEGEATVAGTEADRTLVILFGSVTIVGLGLLLLRWLADRATSA